MATKKNAEKEPEVITEEIEQVKEPGPLEQPDPQMLAMKAEIERLKKENEELRINSISNGSPAGGASDYERVKKASEKAAREGIDPWTVKIGVVAPRLGKGEDSFWLCVNGRTMQVPANERYYELALPLAECLVEEVRNRHRAEDYADTIQVFDPKENPHPVEKIV